MLPRRRAPSANAGSADREILWAAARCRILGADVLPTRQCRHRRAIGRTAGGWGTASSCRPDAGRDGPRTARAGRAARQRVHDDPLERGPSAHHIGVERAAGGVSSPQAFSLSPSSPGGSGPPASAPTSVLPSAPVSSAPVSSAPVSAPPVSSPPPVAGTGVHGTVVVGGATPARMSISVSHALFTSAPTVIVASPTDAAGIASGAQQAQQLDVPLLLLDHDGAAPAGSTPTPALFAAELSRLGTNIVVAIGGSAADVAAAAPSVSVVASCRAGSAGDVG